MMTESEFLSLQAERAKANFKRTLHLLSEDLMAPVDVRGMIQRRPFWSLVGATASGFLAGVGLGTLRRKHKAKAAENGSADKPPAAKDVTGLLADLQRRLRRLVRMTLGTIVIANLRGNHASNGVAKHAANGAPAAERDCV